MKKVFFIVSFLLGLTLNAQEWKSIKKEYNWKNADVLFVSDGVFYSGFQNSDYKIITDMVFIILDNKEEVKQYYKDIETALTKIDEEIIRQKYTIRSTDKSIFFIVDGKTSSPQLKKYIKTGKGGFLATIDDVINHIK